MAEPQKKNPLGPTGKTVADNIKRMRGDMQYVKLAARLEELGRPIPTLGLRKIESYERRVDADDLVALAVALEVSPIALLMPDSAAHDSTVTATGTGDQSARNLLLWLRADGPLPQQLRTANMNLSLPEWWIEAEKSLVADSITKESSHLSQLDAVKERLRSLEQKLQARGDD